MDAVSAADEVVEGADDGQTGADIGFEKKFDAVALGGLLQALVAVVFGRGRNLVGCDDGDVGGKHLFIEAGDVMAGGIVKENGIVKVGGLHPLEVCADVHFFALS